MATNSVRDFPPFPEGIPHAPIAVISSQKLLARDDTTSDAVLEACQTYGFFYLDLTDSPQGRDILHSVEQAYDLAETVFSLPLTEKQAFSPHKSGTQLGYKPAVLQHRQGSSFNFAGQGSYPNIITKQSEVLQSFAKGAHQAALVLLRVLAANLGLPDNAFTELNRFENPSGSHVRLTRKNANPIDDKSIGLPSHTDFGSVTILFNWLGGLQIESRTPGRIGEWEFVKPLPGHAIVNLGDAMVKFTNGAPKSAKHRVVPAPGKQGEIDRISVVYFVRPGDDILMKPLDKFESSNHIKVGGKFNNDTEEGHVYTAAEWLKKRTIQMGS